MADIPENFRDLLDNKKAFAHLATLMPDGTPQLTPVWFDFANGKLRINTARNRLKDKNMTRNPNVAVAISDPANPYRYMQIRGKVVRVTEEGGDAHIDLLAKKYMDKDSYPYRNPAETRVIYEIEPTSVQAYG